MNQKKQYCKKICIKQKDKPYFRCVRKCVSNYKKKTNIR